MTAFADDGFSLSIVSAERLVRLLDDAHWQRTGGREGLYLRYTAPQGTSSDRRSSVVVPLDREARDYEPLLSEALDVLQAVGGDSPGSGILNRLLATPTDEYSFAKETTAPRGWIRWDEGMDLIKSARSLLSSGAKGARERMSYYGNKYGQFANRFLDEVMMGQTTVSSYVVRAYVPINTAIPLKGGQDAEEAPHYVGVDALSGRDISSAVVTTLEAAVEALEHYRTHRSLSAFTVRDGSLSYEAVQAIRAVAENADDSAIRVTWEGASPEAPEQQWEFNFTAENVPVLEQAANELVAPEPQRRVSCRGTVHLLSRSDAGGPGVIGITTATGEPARKLRVRLEPDDYHRALNAHDQGAMVEVSGDLEREGNLSWLYHARITAISAPHEGSTSNDGDNDVPLF